MTQRELLSPYLTDDIEQHINNILDNCNFGIDWEFLGFLEDYKSISDILKRHITISESPMIISRNFKIVDVGCAAGIKWEFIYDRGYPKFKEPVKAKLSELPVLECVESFVNDHKPTHDLTSIDGYFDAFFMLVFEDLEMTSDEYFTRVVDTIKVYFFEHDVYTSELKIEDTDPFMKLNLGENNGNTCSNCN